MCGAGSDLPPEYNPPQPCQAPPPPQVLPQEAFPSPQLTPQLPDSDTSPMTLGKLLITSASFLFSAR